MPNLVVMILLQNGPLTDIENLLKEIRSRIEALKGKNNSENA
jgi:hypothetical protein